MVEIAQRADPCAEPALAKLFTPWLAQVETQIAKVEALREVLLAAETALAARVQRLAEIKGVGRITAVPVLAALPELGRLTDSPVAALAGLCPHNRDRGQWQGQRHLRGGRADVRRARYLAALSASRSNPVRKPCYDRLIAAGKPGKLALTAGRRKLLGLMNHMLKNPKSVLAK